MRITSPDHPELDVLCGRLAEMSAALEKGQHWPSEQLHLCGQYGVYAWFLPEAYGGMQWSDADLYRGYMKLSAACLTTTFIITQRSGACRRIAACQNDAVKQQLLPGLVAGTSFSTLGISHLTTSRRHVSTPAMRAEETPDGFVLDGFSPWVTGGAHADTIVTGAALDDGRQILIVLPTDSPSVSADVPADLVGLSASQTGAVRCERVSVDRQWLLAGPIEDVMTRGKGGATGGLQTSAVALGLAAAAVRFIQDEAQARPNLVAPADQLAAERDAIEADLVALADGVAACTTEDLRIRANSIVLRATQAALTAAKGAGYVSGHPAGRWCREALFFLVWSCPQPVLEASLCELAGIS